MQYVSEICHAGALYVVQSWTSQNSMYAGSSMGEGGSSMGPIQPMEMAMSHSSGLCIDPLPLFQAVGPAEFDTSGSSASFPTLKEAVAKDVKNIKIDSLSRETKLHTQIETELVFRSGLGYVNGKCGGTLSISGLTVSIL